MSSEEANVAIKTIFPMTEKLITMMSVDIKELDIKEVDEFYKNWKKEIKEMKKEATKKKKDDKKGANLKIKEDKKKKNIKLDENGEEKVKVLSKYNIFVKDIQHRIMDMYPDITNKERMGKIAEEWKKHKEIIADNPEASVGV
jgi:hypothetical protein